MRFALYHDMRTEIHKLAQKPQVRQNHKLDQKPQSSAKTTSSPKNHKLAQKPHHATFAVFGFCVGAILAFLCAVRYAHMTRIECGINAYARCFGGFSRFWYAVRYARSKNHKRSTRPQNHTKKPQAIHKPKNDKSKQYQRFAKLIHKNHKNHHHLWSLALLLAFALIYI